MQPGFRRYATIGHRLVDGWVVPQLFPLLAAISADQERNGISGNMAEIGVHHGRLFIGLHLLRAANEGSLAVDIFDRQDLNLDRSGLGDRVKFEQNLDRFASGQLDVTVLQQSSAELSGQKVRATLGGPVRLFSIDGGHTADVVAHDTATAADSLVAGGVVVCDDFFNERWPGVSEGTIRFLNSQKNLVPFAIGWNKVLLTTIDYVDRYIDLTRALAERRLWSTKLSQLCGHDVLICWKAPARTRSARLIRRAPGSTKLTPIVRFVR